MFFFCFFYYSAETQILNISPVFSWLILCTIPGEDKLFFTLLMTQNISPPVEVNIYIFNLIYSHIIPACNKTGMATFFRNPLNHSWINTIFLTSHFTKDCGWWILQYREQIQNIEPVSTLYIFMHLPSMICYIDQRKYVW